MTRPNDLLWWCPVCLATGNHPKHGARKVERVDLPALRRKQAPLFTPSELEPQ